MSEQLFSQFSDLSKLNREKDQVLQLFKEISAAIDSLNEKGLLIDGAKNLGQLARFMREFDGVQGKVSEGLEKVSKAQEKQSKVTLRDIEAIKKAKGVTDEYVASLVKLAQSKQVDAKGKEREKPMTAKNFYMSENMGAAMKEFGSMGPAHKAVSARFDALDEDLKKIYAYAAQFTQFGTVVDGVSNDLEQAAQHVHHHAEESKAAAGDVKAHTEAVKDNTDATDQNISAQEKWARAIEAQKANTAGLLASVDSSRGVASFSDSLGENTTRRDSLKNQMAEIRQAKKELQTLNTGEFAGQFTEQIQQLGEAEEQLKIKIQQANRFISNQAKELIAEEGSIDQLRAKLNQMLQTYDAMGAAGQQSEAGQALERQINDITAAVKEGEEGTDRYFRSVGKYTEALRPLFDKLSERIEKLKQEQKSLQEAGVQNLTPRNQVTGFQIGQGEGPERLNQVNSELQQLEQIQQIGFKTTGSYAQQVKTLENAFGSLAQHGGVSIEFLNEFTQALQSAKQDSRFSSSTFDGAYDVLKNELDAVREKLKDPALKGEALKKLQREEQLLAQLTTSLNKVFTSSTQELRKFQDAAKKVGAEFGADSQVFIEFAEAVGEAKDQAEDIQNIINRNASDTKYLDSAVAAVNGLAGAYGAAQGAAELFSDSDEDVQRSMVKLQALLTLINGLQAIQNALQAESGVVQSVLAGKIQLVNAAKAIQAKLAATSAAAAQAEAIAQGETAVAAEAAALAQAENAVANQAAAAAQGEAAVAAGATAAALEGEAAAAATATAATTTFSTALLATGIGAAIAAIVVGIGYLVKKTFEWAGANKTALEAQNNLARAMQLVNEAANEQAQLFATGDQGLSRYYQKDLDQAIKMGKNAYEQFAFRKALYTEEKRLADTRLADLQTSNKEYAALSTQINSLLGKKQFLAQKLADTPQSDKRGREAVQTVIDSYDAQIAALKPRFDAITSAREGVYNAAKNFNELEIEEAKFAADEQRKLALETVRIEVDAIQSKNALILSSERSTLSERVAAMKNNLTAQRALIRAQRDEVLNNPSSTTIDKTIAIKKAAQEEIKVTRDTNRQIEEDQEKTRLRILQANHATLQRRIEDENELKKKVFSSEQVGLADRLAVFKSYTDNQRKLLDEGYKLQLQQAGVSDEEIAALEKDRNYKVKSKKITDEELLHLQKQHESDVMQLSIDSNEGVVEILRSNLKAQEGLYAEHIAAIERLYEQMDLSSVNQYAGDVIALNDALKRKEVSLAEYNLRREKLDRAYQQRANKDLIVFLQDQLKQLEGAEEKEADAKKRLQYLRFAANAATTDEEKAAILAQIALAEDEYNHYKELVEKKIALSNRLKNAEIKNSDETAQKKKTDTEAWADVYEKATLAALDVSTAFASGSFEREGQRIRGQIDLLDQKTQKEIEAINATAASEEEKAEKIKKIEATSAAQRQALEFRERQNQQKQAKFERDAQALKIFGETMFQAAKLGFITPAAIAIEASGLAAIAMLYARPLPAFAEGTDAAPEGPAQVAEEGPELAVDREGNIVLYREPQIAYLKGGTKIYTAEETEAILGAAPVKTSVKGRALPAAGEAPKLPETPSHRTLTSYLVQPMITIEQVAFDMFRATQSAQQYLLQTPAENRTSAEMRALRQDLAEAVGELGRIKNVLREISKKTGIAIYNETDIMSRAYYRHQLKE